ncbi:carbohydrate-binding protein [Salmonirosea aquatica]
MTPNYLPLLALLLWGTLLRAQVPVPARLEAEAFSASSGLTAGSTSDEDGGSEIGWINDDNWLDYSVAVSAAGLYKFNFRLANGFSDDARLKLKNANGNVLAELAVPRTGGMGSFKTVPLLVNLPAGNQTLRIYIEKGVFSLNWIDVLHDVKTLPGKVEAEAFDRAGAVGTEPTADADGGLNVSQIDDGDWMEYAVTVAEAARFTFTFRVANAYGNGNIQIRDVAGNTLGEVSVIPQTGGWQSWTTVSAVVELPAGEQILRLHSERGTYNLNWWAAEAIPKAPAYLEFAELPARTVEAGTFALVATSNHAESPIEFSTTEPNLVHVYNESGQWYATPLAVGQAYIFATQQSSIGYLATESVPRLLEILPPPPALPGLPGRIEAEVFVTTSGLQAGGTSDPEGGNQEMGWIGDGQWLDYRVAVAQSGYYAFAFRVANGFSDGATVRLLKEDGTVLGSCLVPRTGGMSSWGIARLLVYLQAGEQTLRVDVPTGLFSLNWFEGYRNPKSIPGRVEAEAFDLAGDVRTESAQDDGAGLNVNYIDDGDWMDYSVTVAEAGSYAVCFRVANSYGNGLVEIRTASGQTLSETAIPQTGGWQNWTTVNTTVTLPAGDQVLRIFAQRGAFNLNWIEFAPPGSGPVAAVLQVPQLPDREAGSAPFLLTATSTSTESPVVFTSSNSAVLSLSQTPEGTLATPLAAGTATVTATQAASEHFLAATPVTRTQLVTAPASQLDLTRKIPIDPSRWYVLNNTSNGLDGLFDGQTQQNVNLGYGTVLSSYEAYYPLEAGESMTLEHIKMFDYEGNFSGNPARLSVITQDWTRVPVATFTGEVYNGWVGPYPDRSLSGDAQFALDAPIGNIRYLVLSIQGGLPTELELYGTYVPGNPPAVTTAPRPVKLKDMLGVNAYEWNFQDGNTPWQINEDKMNLVKSFSGVRHYMDWQKLESVEGVYSYNPTLSGGWHYDQIYERCKAEGVEVLACLKTLPDWMLASYPEGERDHENVPVRYGKAFDDPASYLEQAKMAFQYAARYGSNTQVNPALLSVYDTPRWPGDNPNTVKIGMNLIKYLECDNERDKWWKGRKAYQTAREYCANLSAFYDGHMNTMGPGVGAKNADPNMQIVIGGLVSGPEYIRGMVDWCREFRGYKPNGEVNLCWDVINYHIYTDNTSSSQSGTSTRGAAPEVTNAGEKTDAFIRVSDELCHGLPVWITETGFDVHPNSPLKAVPIGDKSALDTQADWILRMSLFSARHGIQKVFFYQMYDDNDWGGIFGSSGLINGNGTRRPAADFLLQTKTQFGEYNYVRTLGQDPIVDQYSHNGELMYALVVPDEVGRTVSYTLSIGASTSARVYRPVAGSDTLAWVDMPATDGMLTLTVGETPLFVVPGTASNVRMGVEEPQAAGPWEVTVFPNPVVRDFLHVTLENGLDQDVEIRLFDATRGTLHYEGTLPFAGKTIRHRLDMSKLVGGEYILEVRQNEKRTFKKVVYLP